MLMTHIHYSMKIHINVIKMHFLYFGVTVFCDVTETMMFSEYIYSLKANLVADCYVPMTCHIKRSPDAEKVQLLCQTATAMCTMS